MFSIILTLCMLTYEGEYCQEYQSEKTFETVDECKSAADKAISDMPYQQTIRVKQVRCERPVSVDKI